MNEHKCLYTLDAWECNGCSRKPLRDRNFHILAPELAENNSNFPANAFDILFELESKNFWFRSRNKLIVWALMNYFPSAQTLLEIGCGTGYVLNGIRQNVPHLKLYGSDIYTKALSFTTKRVDANVFQMDATSIPFEGQFDVICAFDVLEHIEQDQQVLHEIHKALSYDGGVIFTVPQHPSLWSMTDEIACHKRRYTSKEIKTKLTKAGFRILRITSFVTLLLPLLMLSRYKNTKIDHNKFDPARELKLNPIINFILEHILSIERTFIKRGGNLPIGGSLLIIAKRSD